MRRLALLLATPLLLSAAANPVAEAEREAQAAAVEQQRLEQAAAKAQSGAARAAAEASAAAQAMLAAEARIAASEAEIAAVRRRAEALEARLAEARQPATLLLAGLVQLGRRPQWLALAGSGSAEEQVRLAALVRRVRPELDRRTTGLRQEYAALAALGKRQEQVRARLVEQRQAAAAARTRFAQLEQEALATAQSRGGEAVEAGDRVLAQSERLLAVRSGTEQRREAARLAAALARLPAAEPRPTAGEGRPARPPFAWAVPATGAITVGVGELLPTGVRSRGLTIAAARGTQVVAPAAGRVVFAGPFRRRTGVIIIDHGDGWMTLLSEVRPSVSQGNGIGAGQPIGRALGAVTAELFHDGRVEHPALIARSS